MADAAPAHEAVATNAPSEIGALVAPLGVIEFQKLLSKEWESALVARELYIDARHHCHYVTQLIRNPDCRFGHETWDVVEVGALTLGEALELGGAARVASELVVEREAFVGELSCRNCDRRWSLWKLHGALTPEDRVCERCGEISFPAGFDLVEQLSAARVPAERLHRPLADFGLRPGDVFAIRSGGDEAHYQLALASPAPCNRGRARVGGDHAPRNGGRARVDGDHAPRDGSRERADADHAPRDGSRARTSANCAQRESGARAVLAGCGNIGSHVVPHLARNPGVAEVVLVDPDVYEQRNLSGQDIRARDVGRAKVEVQAERLREIRPELRVIAVRDRLERLPFAYFRDAILLGALDSRAARQALNQVAWRADSPWIDMAVDGPGLLCRVSVYRPGVESPCLECGWDPSDYANLRRVLPCEEFTAKE